MEKLIIFPSVTGGLCITTFVDDLFISIEEMVDKIVPKDTPYKIIDRSDLPTDLDFRDAWEFNI